MKLILRIARTELATLFYSPIAWFILIVFSFLTATSFSGIIASMISRMDLQLDKDIANSLSESIFTGQFGFWNTITNNLYIYVPLLTMGLMSRELSSGSIKLLYSSPVTSLQIILGKYLATAIYGAVLLVVPIISILYTGLILPHFDLGAVLPGLLGLYLLTCAYCAIGLFMSSLTEYQVVAAIGTLIVLALLSFIGTIGQEYEFIREITYWFSISGRTGNFLLGVIKSDDFIYFIAIIAMFLTITSLRISFSRRSISKVKSGLSYTTVVVATLMIGYLTSRPNLVGFVDCTRTKSQTITKESQHVMESIKGPVTITNYVNMIDNKSFPYLPRFFKNNEQIFSQYQRYKQDLKVKYVYYYDFAMNGLNNSEKHKDKTLDELRDYMSMVFNLNPNMFKSPEEVANITALKEEGNTFTRIIETKDGQSTFLRDYNDMRRTPGEEEITAACKKMIVETSTVAFVKGHGEREISRPGDFDYSAFTIDKYSRYALMNQGFDVVEVDLSKGETIDSNINIVVIADPKIAFSEREEQLLDNYIARGGNILLLMEAGRLPAIRPLAQRFGISIEEGILAQPVGDFYANLILAQATPESYDLTFGFEKEFKKKKLQVSMPDCMALSIDTTRLLSGFTYIPVLQTRSKGAWIEKETTNMKEETPVFNPAAGEVEKSYVTAYAAHRIVGDKEQRVIVMGDADCFSNSELSISREGYRSGNFNMIVECFRWLSDGEFPIDTRRPDSIDNNFSVTVEAIPFAKMLFLTIVPGIMLLMGIGLWLLRRRN